MFRILVWAGLGALMLLGVTPAPLWAGPSPRLLVEVADLSGPAISPDGRLVAFRQENASIERNTYESRWFVASIDGDGAPLPVADGGVPLRFDNGMVASEAPTWSPDGRWIYFRAAAGGQVQIWRAAADGSKVQAVTDDAADVDSFVLSADGTKLVYRVGADRAAIEQVEQAEYDAGIRIDASTPVGQPLFRSGEVNGRRATIRLTGHWATRSGLLADAPARWRVLEVQSLATRDARPDDLAAVGAASGQPDLPSTVGTLVAVSAQTGARVAGFGDGAAMSLRVTPAKVGEPQVDCPADRCRYVTIAAAAWRPGRDQVLFTTTDHERGRAQSLKLWDVGNGTVRTVVQSDGLIGGGRGFGPNEACAVGAASAVCVEASADVPPHLVRIDLESGAERTLYAPNQALSEGEGPRARLLHWTDAKGEDFTGQFFPAASARVDERPPLFVSYYTCTGYLRGGLGDEWPFASLASAGIAALCINEPHRDPDHLDQLARYQAALSGTAAIIQRLSCEGRIDPARVGMGGLSFGSEVTLWTAMNSHLLAAASVTSPSVTSTYALFHRLQGEEFNSVLKSEWGLGAPSETPARWALLSPQSNVGRIDAPMLMQMPEQEYLEAMDYFVPLAQSATPAEMYVFPDEPHVKVQPRHKLAAYERNLDWFRFWLQGYIDPDPLKAAQYQRWDAMRVRAAEARSAHGATGPEPSSCAIPASRP